MAKMILLSPTTLPTLISSGKQKVVAKITKVVYMSLPPTAHINLKLENFRSRVGTAVRALVSQTTRHMWAEFAGSLPYTKVFLWVLGFPCFLKNQY